MQAGLSWLTILNKRAAFREAFDQFDYQKIALYDEAKINELMQNAQIIRNKLKIKAAIVNAQQFIKIQEEYDSFDAFIWSYVENKPIIPCFSSGRTCAQNSVIPSCEAIFFAAPELSPVSITILSKPDFFSIPTVASASFLGGSEMQSAAVSLSPTARYITEQAPDTASISACCTSVIRRSDYEYVHDLYE